MTATRQVVLHRVRIELVSRDLAFAGGLLLVVAAVQAFGEAFSSTTGFVGVASSSLEILVALWPVIGPLPAGLISARDEESGVREALAANGGPVEVLRDTGLIAGGVISLGFVAVYVAAGLAAGLTSGTGVDSFALGGLLRTITALVLTTPVLAAFGMALGRLTRSRAGAVGALAGLALLAAAVERLAIVIPTARWVHLGSPDGMLDILTNGLGADSMPRGRLSPFPVVGWMVLVTVAGVAVVRWADGRPLPRRRQTPAIPAVVRWAAVASGAVAFGFVGPSLAANALPWQFSPTWVLDQASANTPDRTVKRFVDLALAGPSQEADDLTVEHDAARTLGPLAEVLPAAQEVRTELLTYAKIAGTIKLTWRDTQGEGHEVKACAVRTPNGWRVAFFTSKPECGVIG